jgi:hypothetical protein
MQLLPIVDGGMPACCAGLLAPPGSGDVFAGRAWLETTARHAMPPGTTALMGMAAGGVLLPLMQTGRRIAGMTTPYSLDWQPIGDAAAMRDAGHDLGRCLRLRPPARFDALDPDDPDLAALFDGMRAQGLRLLRFEHFGIWQEDLPSGVDWDAYLAARPPALRNTIARKLVRAARQFDMQVVAAPGPELEAGLAAFQTVRARSWKPDEPFPDFDAFLMRALAGTGELRLGILRDRASGRPAAAQYWIVSAGHAVVPKLFHDEDQRAASPGTVLTALMVKLLLEEDRVRMLDFGRGDDDYKRLWVGTRRRRIGVLALDPRHPAGLAALLRHAAGRLRDRVNVPVAA